MTFITARDLRLKPAKVWDRLEKEGEVVITVNGRPVAIMTGITPGSLQESLQLIKRLRAESALMKIRERASKKGINRLSTVKINAEIKAARKALR
jgi:prevent-host-death family protein